MTSRSMLLAYPNTPVAGGVRDFIAGWGAHVLVGLLPCLCLFTLMSIIPRQFLSLGPTIGSLTLLSLVFVIALPMHAYRQYRCLMDDVFTAEPPVLGAPTVEADSSRWSTPRRSTRKSARIAALEEALIRRSGVAAPRMELGEEWCNMGSDCMISHLSPAERRVLEQAFADLGLPTGASIEEVGRAYRRLMYAFHPDRHRGDEAAHRMAEELARLLALAYARVVSAHRRGFILES